MEFVKCLGHPEEFYNLLRFQMGGRRKVIPKMDQGPESSAEVAASECQTPLAPSFSPGSRPLSRNKDAGEKDLYLADLEG
ncbi:FDFT1 [Cervus elaphus hippelaphus]|uniref:FDFT1 n=1 Tax=Cervus elaphus hippelaphus TaxID=46360 RepID=A0A212C4W3_CEREH|nr:FDFT1 [Cervus elaphus hippelaphus]